MNATLREIVLAVRYGQVSLVGESVGYLVLGAADRVRSVPRSVDVDSVLVTGEGEVVLDAVETSAEGAEVSLRRLLGELLSLLRSPFPNLERIAARTELQGLTHLVLELEAALVPVNRRAARRSLSRLVRETRRNETEQRSEIEQRHGTEQRPAAQLPPATLAPLPHSPAAAPATYRPAPLAALELSPLAPRAEPIEPVSPLARALVEARPEPSELPTPPARPAISSPLRRGSEPQRPVDEVPSLLPREVALVPDLESAAQPELEAAQPAWEEPDPFDEALTRVTNAIEHVPTPRPPARSFRAPRAQGSSFDPEEPWVPSLVPSEPPRPSDVAELLARMQTEAEPAEELFSGLGQLARIDLSPQAPPVL